MNKYEYRMIRSNRKTLALEITKDGTLLVRAPYHVSEETINRFIPVHDFANTVLGQTYCSKQCLGIYLRCLLVVCRPKPLRTPAVSGWGLILFPTKSDALC